MSLLETFSSETMNEKRTKRRDDKNSLSVGWKIEKFGLGCQGKWHGGALR